MTYKPKSCLKIALDHLGLSQELVCRILIGNVAQIQRLEPTFILYFDDLKNFARRD